MPPQGYPYFVSYHLSNGQQTGIGNVEMLLAAPITRMDQVRGIEAYLRQSIGMPGIVVITWQPLEAGPAG